MRIVLPVSMGLLSAMLLAACSQKSPETTASATQEPAGTTAGAAATSPSKATPRADAPAAIDRMTVHAAADKAAFEPAAAQLAGDAIVSTGKPVFIHYGPYVSVAAGHYRLSVEGSVSKVGSEPITVDIASKGKVFAEQKVSAATSGPAIAQVDFELPAQTDNIEFRARVGDGAEARVTGYTLEPIQ
jgi:hypothetical protein